MQRSWDSSVNVVDAEEWEEIYLRPFAVVRETRLQSFQYRLVHRLITCNHLLLRYKIRQDEACAYCNGIDTLEHFFFQCPTSRNFWKLAVQWMRNASGQDLSDLTMKEFLLGVPKTYQHAKRTNFLLLTARYFIHRQRLFHNGDLCITHWTQEIRKRLLTEQHICRAEGKPHKFDMWKQVLAYLG